jgi:hypothetical protein
VTAGSGRPRGLIALLAAAASLLAATAAHAAPSTLTTGFMDNAVTSGVDRDAWLGRMAAVGASRVRIPVSWAAVAPTAPAAGDAGSPSWAGYDFTGVDAQVRSAQANGLAALVGVNAAPAWAEGAGRPATVRPGAWKPNAAAFRSFMQALARRYSGTFPDPLTPGRALPRVTAFQLWNEPNLDTYLAPQYENGKPAAPALFRALLNAGYAGVKAAQPTATVVTAGLAPFGDYGTVATRRRTPPVQFLRSTLCLNAQLRRECGDRTRFDVLAHHPYAIGAPSRKALNVDDVTIPDLGKLTKVTDAARKARTITTVPRLWVTEVSYDSSLPDPDGVPTATLNRWIPELLWRLSSEGVEAVFWYLVRDQDPTPSYGATYQSGMYLADGRLKRSAQAYRFPLLVTGRARNSLRVWLRSPRAGTLKVQVRRAGKWHTAKTMRAAASGIRTVSVPRSRTTSIRAVVGTEASPAWSTP